MCNINNFRWFIILTWPIFMGLVASQSGDEKETPSSFGPQAVSMISTVTAGASSILADQLTKRFPLSFHATTPRWRWPVVSLIGYILVYIGMVAYGIARPGFLSTTLAFMAAPGVPLHGFLWALIPEIHKAPGPPSTEAYIRQCFSRKVLGLLIITVIPLVAAGIAAGLQRSWQGLAVQFAMGVAFLATGRTPGTMPKARENAFGTAGRFLLFPRPGRRDDTVAYCVDLRMRRMLEPVRMSMDGVDAYRKVSEQKLGRLGRESDDATTSEVPMATYLDSFVMQYRAELLHDMTGRLWQTLEEWKHRVTEPAKELALMYGLVERMAYVAYRPGSCTLEERQIAIRLNFLNCRADAGRAGAECQASGAALIEEWRNEGVQLVRSSYWKEARARGKNLVDKEIPEASEVLQGLDVGDGEESEWRDMVETMGSAVSFFRYTYGHNEKLLESIMLRIPHFHSRIKSDLLVQGSIPVVCHGLLFSMKKNSMLKGNVYGHEWASEGATLSWGGGGYALLDQAYARNSAIAYVGQLAVIVIKAVLDN